MHWPGAKAQRSIGADESMDLDEIEEKQLEHDHALNIKSLNYGFNQLKLAEEKSKKETRLPHNKKVKLTLNIGAFIRKAVRNGKEKIMSTYWSYHGSLTTPCKYI